jgi:serine phosphatase RsbU (regulator of sigma subunit)/anti-sigma regulatory factor (Ser/Thr protein kinase)
MHPITLGLEAGPTFLVDNFITETLSLPIRVREEGGLRHSVTRHMDFTGQRYQLSADVRLLDELRVAFGAGLHQAGMMAADVARWQLVFMEAATNAIVHGSGQDPRKKIEISWSLSGGQIRLEVADSGPGLQPGQFTANLPADPLQTSGRGLFLIRHSCDKVELWNGPAGFRMVMLGSAPDLLAPTGAAEGLLQAAMAEISQCYESLAAFYRLGDALIAAERLPDFLRQATADISKVVPHDRLVLHFQPGLQPSLLEELATLPISAHEDPAGTLVERVLNGSREWVWQNMGEVATDSAWQGYACGFCVPLRVGGMTLGTLTMARLRQPYLVASELSMVRTYADLFGIALANANNALVRDRERQALREVEIAAEMQNDLLPLPSETSFSGGRAVVRRRTARSVAGDYVDICPTPDGGMLLAMVDVMGKGISAALFAGMVRTALRINVEMGQPVGRLIEDINRVLCRQTGELTLFATCALFYLTPKRDRALVVNAGHCPALWLGMGNSGPAREFLPSGPPLGLFLNTRYTVEEQPLSPGDQIVLVTDGLYEWETNGDLAGAWTRLADLIRSRREEGGAALWEAIQQRIQAASPGQPDARDDQTLLVWECSG